MEIASLFEDACSNTNQNFEEVEPNYCVNNPLDLFFQKNPDIKREDALQAVKLDPAVIEAQVTVEPKDKPEQVLITKIESSSSKFEEMVTTQLAAIKSLTPEQFNLLLTYTASLRKQRFVPQKNLECAFCKKNGESVSWYSSHSLKTGRGRVRCPVLRAYQCPSCGATGDRAHTRNYCPHRIPADLLSLSNSI